MARVLVSGGAGFIGSHLVRAMLERGHEVRVIDNFETGLRQNVDGLPVELIEGSIDDADAVNRAMDGVKWVLHQAALPSVPKSVAYPFRTHQSNIVGTLTMLEGARAAGVERLVYAASSSAYGDQEAERKSEDLTPRPLSPYAVQKLAGEDYLQVYAALYDVPTVGLRYFNVFGPRQNPKSQYAAVVPAFVTRMLAGESPIVHGDGEQSRDFTYIDNVVDANIAALEADRAACGRVYNAASGHKASVNDLVRLINEGLGTNIPAEHVAPRAGDVRHSCADPTRAREGLGWTSRIDLGEGLRRTIEWYRDESARWAEEK